MKRPTHLRQEVILQVGGLLLPRYHDDLLRHRMHGGDLESTNVDAKRIVEDLFAERRNGVRPRRTTGNDADRYYLQLGKFRELSGLNSNYRQWRK